MLSKTSLVTRRQSHSKKKALMHTGYRIRYASSISAAASRTQTYFAAGSGYIGPHMPWPVRLMVAHSRALSRERAM